MSERGAFTMSERGDWQVTLSIVYKFENFNLGCYHLPVCVEYAESWHN